MLRVFWVHVRIGALHELQYRVNFWIQLLQSVLSVLSSLGALAIVFGHTAALGGWRPLELVALLGIYFFMNGFIQAFVQPGMDGFLADIRRGTFDFVLTKPRDSQLLVMVRRISLWNLLDCGFGLVLLGVALARLGRPLPPAELLALLVVLGSGMVIVGSFWFMLATLAFWFVKIENILFVFQSTYQAGRWPIRIYPRALRLVLTFLVPVAFAVTVPAEAAVGRLDRGTLALAVLLAAGIAAVSRGFWTIGMRRYSGASA